jgi:hypothetical protein
MGYNNDIQKLFYCLCLNLLKDKLPDPWNMDYNVSQCNKLGLYVSRASWLQGYEPVIFKPDNIMEDLEYSHQYCQIYKTLS